MDKTANQIIDALGGTVKVAEICEVSPAAVSQWRENGIPKAQLRYLKLRFPRADWEAMGSPRLRKSPSAPQEGAGAEANDSGAVVAVS